MLRQQQPTVEPPSSSPSRSLTHSQLLAEEARHVTRTIRHACVASMHATNAGPQRDAAPGHVDWGSTRAALAALRSAGAPEEAPIEPQYPL